MTNTGYRQIHPEIWSDPWFAELSPQEKLIFIYLFSNERSSLSGLYEITLRQIAFDTCLDIKIISSALNKFQESGKISRQDNYIFVANLLKRHYSASPKIKTRIIGDVNNIPDCEPKRVWIQKYSELIGYRYGIDTETHKIKEDKIKEDKIKEIDRLPLYDLLLNHFSEYSQLKIPDDKNSKIFFSDWFEPVSNMMESSELDIELTKSLISKSIDMLTGKYSINSPKSILKTFISLIAENKRVKKRDNSMEFRADEFLAEEK